MTVTREMIEDLMRRINEAENGRPNRTVEETVAAIDVLCAPDFEGRLYAGGSHDREGGRQEERWLFSALPDYHRSIDKKIVGPPFAAFEWTITGTWKGIPVKFKGCSVIECSEAGLLRRGFVQLDASQFRQADGRNSGSRRGMSKERQGGNKNVSRREHGAGEAFF